MFNTAKKIFTFDSSESLSKKTAKGSLWLLIFRISDQIFRLVKTIILARLLVPSDFGLFGVTLLAVSLVDTFSQSGFLQALVHKKDDIRPYLDTSFIVQLFRGAAIALMLFIFAPFIASFFGAKEVTAILRVISIGIFIQSLNNIAVIYFSKELEFQKYFVFQISGTLADLFVSVLFAVIFRNVWALVFGFLAGTTLRCVVSYMVYFYVPRFRFDFEKAKELFGYGKWVFGSNIVGFFVTQIDSFFVAKLSGVTSLGFYQMAYKIPSILGLEILAGATFPAYSKIQDDTQRLRDAYLKIIKLFSFILMPVAGGIFVVAADFVKLVLGAEWLPAVWPMRLLTLATLAWTIAVVSDYMFLAIGKPNIQVRWTSVKLLIMLALLYPFISMYGFLGAAIVVFIGSLLATFGFVFEALRIIKCNLIKFSSNIIFSFLDALVMSILVYLLRRCLPDGIVSFLLVIFSGIIIYFILTYATDKLFKNKMFPLLKESMGLLIK